MLLIRTKDAYKNCACENKQKDQAFSMERLSDLGGARESSISTSLPVSSDGRSSGTGVAGDQISRSKGSSDVATLGQMTSILPGSSESGVPARSGSAEGADFASLGEQSERPLGVDSLNRSVGHGVASENISNQHSVLGDLNSGNPKQKVNQVANQSCCGQGASCCQERNLDAGEQHSPEQYQMCDAGEPLAETRSENHVLSTLGGNH